MGPMKSRLRSCFPRGELCLLLCQLAWVDEDDRRLPPNRSTSSPQCACRADLWRPTQDRNQFFHCEPRPPSMDHAVTVRAQQPKVYYLRLLAGSQRVNRLGMVAFDKAFASVPVSLVKVKPAGLASQSPQLSKRASLPCLDQRRLALVPPVHCRDNAALFRFLNCIAARIDYSLALSGDSKGLANGLRRSVATFGI